MGFLDKLNDLWNGPDPHEERFEHSKTIAKALNPFGVSLLFSEESLKHLFVEGYEPVITEQEYTVPKKIVTQRHFQIIPPIESAIFCDYMLEFENDRAISLTMKFKELPKDEVLGETLYKQSVDVVSQMIDADFKKYKSYYGNARTKKHWWNQQWDIINKHSSNYPKDTITKIYLRRVSNYDPDDIATNMMETAAMAEARFNQFYYALKYEAYVWNENPSLSDAEINFYRKIYTDYLDKKFTDLTGEQKDEYNQILFKGKLVFDKK